MPASEFPAVRNVFGAGATADVVSLMVTHGEQIVMRGERKWFTEHGIVCRVQTYS